MTAAAFALLPWIGAVAFLVHRRVSFGYGGTARSVAVGALAVGLGIGGSSLVYFLWITCLRPLGVPLWGLDALAVGGLLAAGRRPVADRPRPERQGSRPHVGIAVCASLLAAAVAGCWITRQLSHPAGGDDAVAIWNLHARALSRGGDAWSEFFATPSGGAIHATHTDYPLLLPGAIARLASLEGVERPSHSQFIAVAFAAATVASVFAAVAGRNGTNAGLLAAIALMGTSGFVKSGGSQYADVPLAFFMLSAVTCFCRDLRDAPGGGGLTVIAGAAAGMAAWTKNEGLLFAAALLAGLAASGWGGWAKARATMARLLSGAFPAAAAVAAYKLNYAPTNDLVAGQTSGETIARLADPARVATIVAGWAEHFFEMAKVLGPVLILYALLMGRSAARPRGAEFRFVATTLAATVGGYSLVYLITPHDLGWHLATSAQRLLVQLWPSAVVFFFWNVASPDEARGPVAGDAARGLPRPTRAASAA